MSEGFSNPIIGGAENIVRSGMKSPDYVPGTTGWRLAKDGSADLNDVDVRGTVDVEGVNGSHIKLANIANLDASILLKGQTIAPPIVEAAESDGVVRGGNDQNGTSTMGYLSLYPPSFNPINRGYPQLDMISEAYDGSNGPYFRVFEPNGGPLTFLFEGEVQADGPLKVGGVVPGAVSRQVFTASGTWNKPNGAKYVYIQTIGGGGGGGGTVATGATTSAVGGGGQGGGYADSNVNANTLGASVAVTVGTGGAGNSGANGSAGGYSSFGAVVGADGGGGGGAGAASAATGIASGGMVAQTLNGDVQTPGQPGSPGIRSGVGGNQMIGGNGGSTPLGTGGYAASNAVGSAGLGYGGGGGGASSAISLGARSGGSGANGVVIVTTYF